MAKPTKILYIGIRNYVVALDQTNGAELWRQKLKCAQFTALHVEDDAVFAGNRGEVYCLDRMTGAIRWHNELKGFGLGIVSFAGTSGGPAAVIAANNAAAAVVVGSVAAS